MSTLAPSSYYYKSAIVRTLFRAIDVAGSAICRASGRFESPRKILLIRLDHLGDMLYTLSAIRGLRRACPEATIHLLAAPWLKEILSREKTIDEVIYFNPPWFRAPGYASGSWSSFFPLLKRLRQKEYDLAIDFKGYMWHTLLMAAARIKYRVGYPDVGFHFLLHHKGVRRFDRHILQLNIDLLKSIGNLGITADNNAPSLDLTAADERRVDVFWREAGFDAGIPLVAVHLGAGQEFKRWPLENFVELLAWLKNQFRVRIVIVGGGSDKQLAERCCRTLGADVIDATEKFSIFELAAFLKRCRLFIGNSSFPGHLAAVMGTPTVTLFHDSDAPAVWKPWGEKSRLVLPDRPLSGCGLGPTTSDRMRKISVEKVKGVVASLLKQ